MAIGISFFQIDNLVRNKIPFFLLKDHSDINPHFGPMEKQHLQNYSITLKDFTPNEAEALMKEKSGKNESPIVVLCENGERSKKLAEDLDGKGYLNVYFVLDGFKAFHAT